MSAKIVALLKAMSSPATEAQKTALKKAIYNLGRTLKLNGTNLSVVDVKNLCEALKNDTQVESLGLSHLDGYPFNQPLPPEILASIADLLRHNTALKTLNLSGNYLSDYAGIILFPALIDNVDSALEKLFLTANRVKVTSLFSNLLSHTKLKQLSLVANNLGNDSITAIETLIKSPNNTLEQIDLTINPNLDLAILADLIDEDADHPVRSSAFLGEDANYRAHRDSEVSIGEKFAKHAAKMRQKSYLLGHSLKESLPFNVANIANQYLGGTQKDFEEGYRESSDTVLEQTQKIPTQTIEAESPSHRYNEEAQLAQAPIIKESPVIATEYKKLLAKGIVSVLGITLIGLSALISPILAIALASVAIGTIGFMVYKGVYLNKPASEPPTLRPPEQDLSEVALSTTVYNTVVQQPRITISAAPIVKASAEPEDDKPKANTLNGN